jgi:hypothetical protein
VELGDWEIKFQNFPIYKFQNMSKEEQLHETNDELYERFNFTVDKGQEPLRIDEW